jgi:hypothetical protein
MFGDAPPARTADTGRLSFNSPPTPRPLSRAGQRPLGTVH